MNPNRWRYGSSGKRRRELAVELGQRLGVAGEARREARGATALGGVARGDRLRSRVATAS